VTPAGLRDGIRPLLFPRSVAVVGASDRTAEGASALRQVLAGGAPTWFVNPTRPEVLGRECFDSVTSLADATIPMILPSALVSGLALARIERQPPSLCDVRYSMVPEFISPLVSRRKNSSSDSRSSGCGRSSSFMPMNSTGV